MPITKEFLHKENIEFQKHYQKFLPEGYKFGIGNKGSVVILDKDNKEFQMVPPFEFDVADLQDEEKDVANKIVNDSDFRDLYSSYIAWIQMDSMGEENVKGLIEDAMGKTKVDSAAKETLWEDGKGNKVVKEYRNQGGNFKDDKGSFSLFVEYEKGFKSDSPVVYEDGKVAYDFPERIPQYIKDKVSKLAKEFMPKWAAGTAKNQKHWDKEKPETPVDCLPMDSSEEEADAALPKMTWNVFFPKGTYAGTTIAQSGINALTNIIFRDARIVYKDKTYTSEAEKKTLVSLLKSNNDWSAVSGDLTKDQIETIEKNLDKVDAQVTAKTKGIELPKSNLLFYGFNKDINGNTIAKLAFFYADRGFSIQTNGNLPESHSLRGKSLKELTPEDLKTIRDEAVDYINKHGTLNQKSALKVTSQTADVEVGDKVLVYSPRQKHPVDRGIVTKIEKDIVYVDNHPWEKEYDIVVQTKYYDVKSQTLDGSPEPEIKRPKTEEPKDFATLEEIKIKARQLVQNNPALSDKEAQKLAKEEFMKEGKRINPIVDLVTGTLTGKDRAEFKGFCKNATDKQIVNIYKKEKDAGRDEYADLAMDEIETRGLQEMVEGQAEEDFKVGDKVIFSVYPHYKDKLGVVTKDGVEVLDEAVRKELEEENISLVAEWQHITDIKKSTEASPKKQLDFTQYYDPEEIKEEVEKWYKEIQANKEQYVNEYDSTVPIIIDTITGGAAGTTQPNDIAEFFGEENLGYKYDEEEKKWYHVDNPEEKFTEIRDDADAWDGIERYTNKVADAINNKIEIKGIAVTFGFGHSDSDGDYGLFAYFDTEQFNEATSEFKEIASKLPEDNNIVENLSRVFSERDVDTIEAAFSRNSDLLKVEAELQSRLSDSIYKRLVEVLAFHAGYPLNRKNRTLAMLVEKYINKNTKFAFGKEEFKVRKPNCINAFMDTEVNKICALKEYEGTVKRAHRACKEDLEEGDKVVIREVNPHTVKVCVGPNSESYDLDVAEENKLYKERYEVTPKAEGQTPKFKVGDKIQNQDENFMWLMPSHKITEIKDGQYWTLDRGQTVPIGDIETIDKGPYVAVGKTISWFITNAESLIINENEDDAADFIALTKKALGEEEILNKRLDPRKEFKVKWEEADKLALALYNKYQDKYSLANADVDMLAEYAMELKDPDGEKLFNCINYCDQVVARYGLTEKDVEMILGTGEMSKEDLEKGGEWYEARLALESICKDAKLGNCKVLPFDVYRGPYAMIPKLGKLWLAEDELFFFESYDEKDQFTGSEVEMVDYLAGKKSQAAVKYFTSGVRGALQEFLADKEWAKDVDLEDDEAMMEVIYTQIGPDDDLKEFLVKEGMMESAADRLVDQVGGMAEGQVGFSVKDFENLIKANPDDILKYLKEKFPNKETQFVAWVLQEYEDDNAKLFLEDIKTFAKKISEIKFESGILGKDFIKRKISPTKYRLLGLD